MPLSSARHNSTCPAPARLRPTRFRLGPGRPACFIRRLQTLGAFRDVRRHPFRCLFRRRQARQKGIRVITYDADALPDSREFFVNQATPEGIGNTLMDECARLIGPQGEYAIITASLTAGNMIEWQKAIEKRNAEKYPGLT